jgi:hypothetical protein
MSGRVGSAFDLAAVVALPLWTAAVIAAFFVVVCVLALVRGWPDGRGMTVARVAVVLIAALIGSVVIDHVVRRDLAGDRRALDTLTHELTARAIMPGSGLACLDAMAGDAVESSCERALFATPEATAAAVSYVGAQLSLLAAGSAQARLEPSQEATLAHLRRAAELDRFGIVAHVLAVRDGCTPAQCGAFAMLHDPSRVRANMAERTYASLVNRHAVAWVPAADRAVAAHSPAVGPEAPAAGPVAAAKPPSNLFFPSSSSIPAVSIMSAEPPAHAPAHPPATTGAAETTTPATPPRKPPPAQARQPAGNAAARPAPLPLAPSGQ